MSDRGTTAVCVKAEAESLLVVTPVVAGRITLVLVKLDVDVFFMVVFSRLEPDGTFVKLLTLVRFDGDCLRVLVLLLLVTDDADGLTVLLLLLDSDSRAVFCGSITGDTMPRSTSLISSNTVDLNINKSYFINTKYNN